MLRLNASKSWGMPSITRCSCKGPFWVSRSRLGRTLAVVLPVFVAGVGGIGPVAAHVPTPINQAEALLCGFFSSSVYLYSNLGPSDREWNFVVRAGLATGDSIQRVWFEFWVFDLNRPSEDNRTGQRSAAIDDWLVVPGYVFADTITVHAAGTVSVYFYFDNPESNWQCFNVFADGVYYKV